MPSCRITNKIQNDLSTTFSPTESVWIAEQIVAKNPQLIIEDNLLDVVNMDNIEETSNIIDNNNLFTTQLAIELINGEVIPYTNGIERASIISVGVIDHIGKYRTNVSTTDIYNAYEFNDDISSTLSGNIRINESPKITLDTVKSELKTLMTSLGIELQAVAGIENDALGAADVLNKTIRLAVNNINPSEINEVLAEEIAHIYLSMIKNNDVLKGAMIKNIHKFEEYAQVKETYKDTYTEESQFVEEAIGKVMAKVIMDKVNGNTTTHQFAHSWLDSVLKWIRNIFKSKSTEINSFEALLSPYKNLNTELFSGNINRLTERSSGTYYNISRDVDVIRKLVRNVQEEASLRGITVQNSTDSIDSDEIDQVSNYTTIDGKIYNRVTSLSSEGNKYKFKSVTERTAELDSQLSAGFIAQDHYNKEKFKIHYSADIGTMYHKLMETYLLNNVIGNPIETHRLTINAMLSTKWFSNMDTIEAKQLISNLLQGEVFAGLEIFFEDRIANGSIFYTETTVMDDSKNIAGTVDLIEVTKDGKVNILDLKTVMNSSSIYSQDKRQGWAKQLSLYSRIIEKNNAELDIDSLFIVPAVIHLNNAVIDKVIDNTDDSWSAAKTRKFIEILLQPEVQKTNNISTLAVEYSRTFAELKIPLKGNEARRSRQIKSFTGKPHIDAMVAILKNNLLLVNSQLRNKFNTIDKVKLSNLAKAYTIEIEKLTKASNASEILIIVEEEIKLADSILQTYIKSSDLDIEARTRLQDAVNRLGSIQKWIEDCIADKDFLASMSPNLSTTTMKKFDMGSLVAQLNNMMLQSQSLVNDMNKLRIDDGLKKTVEAYKGKFTEEELTKARQDQGSFTTWLSSLSRSPDPIAQYAGLVLQDIEHNRNVEFKRDRDELFKLITELQNEFPNLKGKDLYDFMLESEEVDGQKVYTGNVVKQYKAEYYKLKYKLKGDKQAEFIKDNEIYIPPAIAHNMINKMRAAANTNYIPPTYTEIYDASTTKERLFLEEEFGFKFTDILLREKSGEAVALPVELNELIEESLARYEEFLEEKEIAKAVGDINAENRLSISKYIQSTFEDGKHITDNNGYRFLTTKPKNSKNWDSAKYSELQRSASRKAFYDKVVEKLKEGRNILPVIREGKFVKSKYYLPELQESTSERIARRGILGVFDGGKRALAGIIAEPHAGIQYEVASSYEGTPIDTLPVYMFNTGMQERSFDVGKVMEAFLFNVYQYKHAQEAEPLINNLLETIGSITYSNSKLRTVLGNYVGNIIGNTSNVFKKTKATRDALLYGKRREPRAPSKIHLGRFRLADGREQELYISPAVILDSLRTLTVWTGMAIAPFSAAANLAIGVVNNMIFAGERGEFGFIGLMKGWKRYFSPGDREKLFRIMEELNLSLDIEDITFSGNTKLSTSENKWIERIKEMPFAMHKGGEHLNYATLIAAMLEKDGMWDKIEIKDGKVIFPAEFNARSFEYIANEVHRNIQGEYSTAHPTLIKKYALGRAAMLFRTFLPQLISEFTRTEYYSLVREKSVKGRFITMWDVTKGIYDNFKITPNILHAVSTNWKGLQEVDKANVRKMAYHMMALAVFVMASSILDLTSALGWEDDEQEERRKRLKKANRGVYFAAHNSIGRVIKDLQFFLDADAAMSLTKFPITNTIGNLFDILESAVETIQGKGTYERGTYKGESKLMKDIIVATPIVNQARTTWIKYTTQDLTKSYKR